MFANVFKIQDASEGFAADMVGRWQVDVFPDRRVSALALWGMDFATWNEAYDYAQQEVVR